MDFAIAEARLNELAMFGIRLGLEQIRELLKRLGSPEQGLRFIHIAGSNGKGSVGAMLAAALRRAGFRVGFFSSPHLVSVRERFRIDGKAIGAAEFAELMEELMPAVDAMRGNGLSPTYFEVNTAMAVLYFARRQVDFVVWETGMGGRLDATNAVTPIASVITGISLEHQQYLGNTVGQIAGEKAGIVKPGVPVFTGIMPYEAAEVIKEKAAELNAPLQTIPDAWRQPVNPIFHAADFSQEFTLGEHRIRLGLAGRVQQMNGALVLLVLEFLAAQYKFSLAAAIAGLAEARWPARLQLLPGGIVLDGAHNPEGAAALADTLRDYFPGQRFNIVFGSLSDKDTAEVLESLAPLARQFLFVDFDGPRPARPPAQLQAMLKKIDPGVPSQVASSLGEAVLSVNSMPPVLVTGSLYLAGKLLNDLLPHEQTLDILD